MARNERGAGRKPALSAEDVKIIRERHETGATVTALAKEYGISRQVLSGYLNQNNDLSLIPFSEPTRHLRISYAVFCWKKKRGGGGG
ncbi:MAG: Hin recombinase, partial [Lachnospiraceae bacterium]|nr:Hin recombinase [Lachnospiraceae bacterium]